MGREFAPSFLYPGAETIVKAVSSRRHGTSLVPKLGPNITAGSSGHIHFILVPVFAVGALPHQFAVLVAYNLNFPVVTANLTVIAFCIQLCVHNISLGYAGLSECTFYMTGKTHTDIEATPFALQVMQHLSRRKLCQIPIFAVLCNIVFLQDVNQLGKGRCN